MIKRIICIVFTLCILGAVLLTSINAAPSYVGGDYATVLLVAEDSNYNNYPMAQRSIDGFMPNRIENGFMYHFFGEDFLNEGTSNPYYYSDTAIKIELVDGSYFEVIFYGGEYSVLYHKLSYNGYDSNYLINFDLAVGEDFQLYYDLHGVLYIDVYYISSPMNTIKCDLDFFGCVVSCNYDGDYLDQYWDGYFDGQSAGYDVGYYQGYEGGYRRGEMDAVASLDEHERELIFKDGYTYGRTEGYDDGLEAGAAEAYKRGFAAGQDTENIVGNAIGGFFDGLTNFFSPFFTMGVGALNVYNLISMCIIAVIVMIILKIVRG